jgi:hypothetical protein
MVVVVVVPTACVSVCALLQSPTARYEGSES